MIIVKGKPKYKAIEEILSQINPTDRGYFLTVDDGDIKESYVAFNHDENGPLINEQVTRRIVHINSGMALPSILLHNDEIKL